MECPECEMTFTKVSKMKAHMLTHIPMKIYECGICHTKLSTQYSLTRHMHMHNEKKGFRCQDCDIDFTTKEHLVRHFKSRKHNPIICTVCNSHFLHQVSFKYHSCIKLETIKIENDIIHSDREFAIDSREPEKYNTDLGDIQLTKKRKRNEKGSFTCPMEWCKKVYTKRSNLRTHLRTAHQKQGFKCPECDKELMHKHSLIKHLKVIHNVDPS
jgi:KRAB domain-containing zinc finger protein